MRLRKATVSGIEVNPAVLAPPSIHYGQDGGGIPLVPYEISFTLGDLRPAFFRAYAEWLADMREYPDPEDEVEADLRRLGWPSLGVLLEAEPEAFAVVLLCLGKELLQDLEWGRDPLVRVEYAPSSVDEVELRGRNIVLRGVAMALRQGIVAPN